MTSKEKVSMLQAVWNSVFPAKTEEQKEETKPTEMAAEVAPADAAKAEAAPAVDMSAKLDEVLAAIAALGAKMGEMETAKAEDAVAMSAIKDTVGGLIEANTLMSAELVEMKNIPMGEIAGKTKSEDKTPLNDKIEKKFTSTYENLLARLADRNKN